MTSAILILLRSFTFTVMRHVPTRKRYTQTTLLSDCTPRLNIHESSSVCTSFWNVSSPALLPRACPPYSSPTHLFLHDQRPTDTPLTGTCFGFSSLSQASCFSKPPSPSAGSASTTRGAHVAGSACERRASLSSADRRSFGLATYLFETRSRTSTCDRRQKLRDGLWSANFAPFSKISRPISRPRLNSP